MNAATIAQALGNTRRVGEEHICTCPLADEHKHGDAHPSLHLRDTSDGKVLARCQSRHASEQNRVIAALKLRGLWPSGNSDERRSAATTAAKPPAATPETKQSNGRWIVPIPEDAPDIKWYIEWKSRKKSEESGRPIKDEVGLSDYRNETSQILFYTLRLTYNDNDGSTGKPGKEVLPVVLWQDDGKHKPHWKSKWPDAPRTLYRLELLAQQPGKPVIWVEGEPKCDLANGLEGFKYTAVASSGGSSRVKETDFFPLAQSGVKAIVFPDNDKPGFHAGIDTAEAIESAQGKILGAIRQSVLIVKPDPTWPNGHDIGDLIAAGWSAQQLHDYIEKNTVGIDEFRRYGCEQFPKEKDANTKEKKPTQADILINIGKAAELFHDDEDTFATFDVNGHRETYPIRSKGFKRWLLKTYLEIVEKSPSAEAMGAAINALEAIAYHEGEERKTFVRIAKAGDKLYLDLCNANWEVVEIDADNWRVIESRNCPVRFRRAKGMRALPAPERGGSIERLRDFVNVEKDDDPASIEPDKDFILTVGWLVGAFRDHGPYPILTMHGEQGSAKTSTARYLRELIDPNVSPLRSEPKEPRDLMIAANNSWLLGYDNLSHLLQWLSDAFCRMSTGGGFSTRALFTDQDEIIFEAQRPMLMTGIAEVATQGDLLDRSIAIYLPHIPEDKRKLETEMDRDFYAARPHILGALLDAVSGALRNYESTKLDKLPRMADFAKWISAAEPALGWARGSFMRAYTANREAAVELTLEASIIAATFERLVLEHLKLPWKGAAAQLLELLNGLADEKARKDKFWPKSPRGLSGTLRRLAPALAQTGIEVIFHKPSRTTGAKRLIEIKWTTKDAPASKGMEPSPQSPSSPNQQNQALFGDGHKNGTVSANGFASQPPEAGDGRAQSGDDSEFQPSPKNSNEIKAGDAGDGGDAKIPTLSALPAPEDSNVTLREQREQPEQQNNDNEWDEV